jgi:hypothetical protein
MKRSKKQPEPVSPTFFLEVMSHWTIPGVVGAVVGLSLLFLCSGPWGITLGVAALFSGAIFSAARFFGSNTVAHKKPRTSKRSREKETTKSVPYPVPDSDPLERFLSLLGGLDSNSPLIKSINKIKTIGESGTELHVDYLARLFAIPYRVVGVSGDVRVDDFGNVSHFNPGKSDAIQSGYTNCIQLINHGGRHWTTMFGKEPVVGETDTRNYINNPGGGDCLFYAFSLGLARLLCKDVQDASALEKSALFQTWRTLDPRMAKTSAAKALYQLGKENNPLNHMIICKNWSFFQRSLRDLVAKSMCEQLTHEGASALNAYQQIQANPKNQSKGNELVIIKLFDENPLYREFNMLYNLDKKAGPEDFATNIFNDLHPTHKSMAYTL